jgi:uncharacterized protein (DUF305 family)
MRIAAARKLLAWGSVWCALLIPYGTTKARADGPAPRPEQRRYEIRFLEGMIDHHAMAVMVAEMCLEKELPHPELTEMCENIAMIQMAEIEQMQTWLADWYGREHEPEMTRRMMREMEMLAELDGEEFEIAFMEMMIQHHRQAIRAGRQCVRRASHEALIGLCHDIIVSQAAEIEQMEAWLCEWYDICKSHNN